MTSIGESKILFLAVLFSVATKIPAPAQDFTILSHFTEHNGANPTLVQGDDGNFYGTQPTGGGAVISVTPTGAITVLKELDLPNYPQTGLVLGSDGNFYGTNPGAGGAGFYASTIFKVTPSGNVTTLYTFCAQPNCRDGTGPFASLILGVDGSFYGTTDEGGGQPGCGTVFKITQDGVLTTLHRFDCSKGSPNPRAPLVQATDGNFYGTTIGAGANNAGTVFRITPAGKLTTVYSFCTQMVQSQAIRSCPDGEYPLALVQAKDGNFYGITQQGGSVQGNCVRFSGCGTVYKLTVDKENGRGMLTTLHRFHDSDGNGPATLVQGTDGNFYGVTSGGGVGLNGTLFTITAEGHLVTLHNFCASGMLEDCPDGEAPQQVFQSTDGKFYGTTSQDLVKNTGDSGAFFCLDMSLRPFVSFVRAGGRAGETVEILGQEFGGTTKVSFHGISAKFTVVSGTFIKATVPAGAITGYVTVITPSGRLTSNLPFQVIQ